MFLTGKSKKAFKGIGIITLISGLSFLIPEYLVARYLGAELPVVIGSVCSMACTIWAAKFFGKKEIPSEYCLEEQTNNKVSSKEALLAWSPFILIFIFLIVTSNLIAPLNQLLAGVKTSVNIYTGEGAAPYTFSWLTTPGVWIIFAAIIGGKIQGANFSKILTIFKDTVLQLSKTIITIISIMASAKLMGYSGMIGSIAIMFVTLTGSYYPLFAPFLGSIGTFVTGAVPLRAFYLVVCGETSIALNLNNLVAASIRRKQSQQRYFATSIAVAAVICRKRTSRCYKILHSFPCHSKIFTYVGIQY